ncbi:hypothetical protein GCM10011534_21950 [Pseudooceanicola nanhaiensis]|uniref:Uncharacterized protein n=1 Tax=Pseudooceanicola nanhaiensis TaxID=375761 RepID=A0A917SVJ1_9RHOB|nr:hypothetical protein GCM10011534_21950 [Pseudooceanicola nanhaiensis]
MPEASDGSTARASCTTLVGVVLSDLFQVPSQKMTMRFTAPLQAAPLRRGGLRPLKAQPALGSSQSCAETLVFS